MEGLPALLASIDAGELGDPLPLLAYIAGQDVGIGQDELEAACRRSLLLRAAGGDPARALELDERAVKALARDLYTEERRASLGAALDRLAPLARRLPRLREAVLFLAADLDLTWRLYALGVLAEALGA